MTTNPSDVSARLRPKWDRDVPFMRAVIKLRDHDELSAASALNVAIVEANAERTEAAALIDSQAKLLAEREWRDISIKPLEWEFNGQAYGTYTARSILGAYTAWELGGNGYWTPDANPGRRVAGGLVEAKAAAQADYETRIRSAIVLPSPPKLSEPT